MRKTAHVLLFLKNRGTPIYDKTDFMGKFKLNLDSILIFAFEIKVLETKVKKECFSETSNHGLKT
jgi:hypothetical protein